MARFDIRIEPIWRAPMLLIGVTPANSFVELDDHQLALHYGAYREQIPRAAILAAAERDWSWTYGYGLRLVPGGVIGYVASKHGVVQLDLAEAQAFRILFGWRLKRRHVAFSLHDPRGFLDALGVGPATSPNAPSAP